VTLTEEQRAELEQALEIGRQVRPDQLPAPAPWWGPFAIVRTCELIDDDEQHRE